MIAPLSADPDFPRLKDHLIRSTGLAYYADKDTDLATRLVRRLSARSAPDCGSYLALLTGGPEGEAELDTLIADLTIGETFFFRHRELFAALREVVLPDLISRNRSTRRLRIWSAGCSVGAEPYSIALLLRRDLAAAIAGWDVSILGTDINREFLARAREGCFEEWALRGVPEDVRRDCFERVGNGWAIRPIYREGVSFQYHNLVAHEFPSRLHDLADFDLILCRNVTIYFGPDIIRRIISHFHQTLTDGGWLAVGHAEPNVELFRAFRTVNAAGAVLYQKAAPSDPAPPTGPLWVWPSADALPAVRPEPEPATVIPAPIPARPDPQPAPDLGVIRALADCGAWAAAVRACEQLLAGDQLNAAVHFYHGLVLEHAGQHAAAEVALRRVIYLDRGHVLAHYYLGLFLQRQRKLPDAARSFRNALRLLAPVPPNEVFADGDGITADELTRLVRMHLEALEGV